MSIRDLLAGMKPRTKTVILHDGFSIVLHEFSTAQRLTIISEMQKLNEQDAPPDKMNRAAATVVARSMLAPDTDVTEQDVDYLLSTIGLDALDSLYVHALQFGGLLESGAEDARKNS